MTTRICAVAHSSTRKKALTRLLRDTGAGILFNEHVAEDGPTVFAHGCRLAAEGIVSKKVDGTYRSGPCPVWSATPPASRYSESAPVKTSIAQLVMQDARNDQLFRPVNFCSFDCFWQSAHFSFSLAHLAFA